MHRTTSLIGVVAGLGLAALSATTVPAAAVSVLPPTITAHPGSVMVNTKTTLICQNFVPRTTLQIVECSQTVWLVPQNPCSSGNGITVTTNAKGGFRARLKVEACPTVVPPPSTALAELCYVGVPKLGLDTVSLVPDAKIVVTYP